MKRILFAINNKSAEQKLAKLIKENDQNEQYQVVGTLVSNESITEFLRNKTTDILVYVEGLSGKEDGFDYILRLHRTHPHIRIVFIAGQRSVGDKKLATLVAFHIYDIIAGSKILMPDVANRIINPAKFEDVVMYLPDGADLFRDSDFESRTPNINIQGAQNNSEQTAERAALMQKVQEHENTIRSLNIKLSADETRLREFENERATWRETMSRDRLEIEKSFEAEKNALNAQIIELTEKLNAIAEEKRQAEKNYRELQTKYNEQEKTLANTRTNNTTSIATLQNELRAARKSFEEKDREYNKVASELKSLKESLVSEREKIISEAKKEADKMIAEAEQREEEAAKLNAELQNKLALYGDKSFEEYKAAETARIEELKASTQKQIDEALAKCEETIKKEYSEAQVAKVQRLNELDEMISSKEAEVGDINAKIKNAEEEVRKARQDEILRMDSAIEQKRKEAESIDAVIAQEMAAKRDAKIKEIDSLAETIVARRKEAEEMDQQLADKRNEMLGVDEELDEVRRKKNADIQAIESEKAAAIKKIEEEFARKSLEAQNVTMEQEQKFIEEQRAKADEELRKIQSAVEIERNRCEEQIAEYKQDLIDRKKALDQDYGFTYTYDEKDFLSGTSLIKTCKPILFYSPIAGTGNSTMALNVASFLAVMGHKTIYVELNDKHPTLKETLGISIMQDTIDRCYDGIRTKNHSVIEQNIITKQKIVNLKTSALQMHSKLPDMLNYLSHTEGRNNKYKMSMDFVKGLIAYLKYIKHYEYIILDVPAYIDKKTLNELYTLCTKHVVSINQDILSLNNLIGIKDTVGNIEAIEKTCFVINRYVDGTVLSSGKIAEICNIKKPLVIPTEINDTILAAYKSVPVVLISRSKELVGSYKAVFEYIKE